MSVGSCGYSARRSDVQLGGVEAGRQSGDARIWIPLLDSIAVKAGAEDALTSSLRDTLDRAHGIRIVDREEDADFVLLGTVQRWSRAPGPSLVAGPTFQRGRAIAADIRLSLEVSFSLIQRSNKNKLRPILWTRLFGIESVIQASRRFEGAGVATSSASSSGPFINESRERLQLEVMSDSIALQVLDQVAQDF